MMVFASTLSALSTNPESRCGLRPTVVRITRSHKTSTGGNATGNRAGVVRAGDFAAHPPSPRPRTPRPPSLIAVRLSMPLPSVYGAHRSTLIPSVPTDMLRRHHEEHVKTDDSLCDLRGLCADVHSAVEAAPARGRID